MITITLTLDIPPKIAEELANGIYYRTGGMIRKVAGTKSIVTWLRDVPNVSMNNLMTLADIASSVSILNLDISVMGFAAVLHKLKDLEERLQKI